MTRNIVYIYRKDCKMEENETYNNDIVDDNVVEYEPETADAEPGGNAYLTLAGFVGAGVAAGIAFHKWVMPKINKAANKAKDRVVKVLTKDKEHYVIEDDQKVKVIELEDTKK